MYTDLLVFAFPFAGGHAPATICVERIMVYLFCEYFVIRIALGVRAVLARKTQNFRHRTIHCRPSVRQLLRMFLTT